MTILQSLLFHIVPSTQTWAMLVALDHKQLNLLSQLSEVLENPNLPALLQTTMTQQSNPLMNPSSSSGTVNSTRTNSTPEDEQNKILNNVETFRNGNSMKTRVEMDSTPFPASPIMFNCIWDIFRHCPNCGEYATESESQQLVVRLLAKAAKAKSTPHLSRPNENSYIYIHIETNQNSYSHNSFLNLRIQIMKLPKSVFVVCWWGVAKLQEC